LSGIHDPEAAALAQNTKGTKMIDRTHLMAVLLLPALVAVACSGEESVAPGAASAPVASTAGAAATRPAAAATLSSAETAGLLYMREEEKLAHDVYVLSNERWRNRVFANIIDSESEHMAAMKKLLDSYGLDDPAQGRGVGSFADPALQALFDVLAARSTQSTVEALIVGAEIEEIDLIDIVKRKSEADNPDIVRTYENLIEGSKNHLRAFVKVLASMSIEYQPRHLSVEEYLAAISG
jgi:hypothetical protein